ncbi:MAG: nucleoside monophosphate kinase [Candidatus Taylorbacteria bacterium]|nr:nucleoside monophosphate kinase [Candidatus Taylorbacteria bacterium]
MGEKKFGLFISPPAGGKGSTIKPFNRATVPISMSGVLKQWKTHSEYGRAIQHAFKEGTLVPDHIVAKAFDQAWEEIKTTLDNRVPMLDGCVRTMHQVHLVIKTLHKDGFTPYVVLMPTPTEVCLERAKNRKREDDYLIKERLEEYKRVTIPLMKSLHKGRKSMHLLLVYGALPLRRRVERVAEFLDIIPDEKVPLEVCSTIQN